MISASKKRLILAIYIDFLVFSVPWAAIVWLMRENIPNFAGEPIWVQFVAFAFVEALLVKFARWSPGQFALGIKLTTAKDDKTGATKPIFLVASGLLQREAWWTILLGVVAILDGSKSLIRWALWHTPMPLFGQQLSEGQFIAYSIGVGLLEMLMGFLILLTHKIGAAISIAYTLLFGFSILLSQSLLPDWIAAEQTSRRAYQGIPLREGEIEQMHEFYMVFTLGMIAVFVVISILAFLRFSKPQQAND